jgi:hypothetical protein
MQEKKIKEAKKNLDYGVPVEELPTLSFNEGLYLTFLCLHFESNMHFVIYCSQGEDCRNWKAAFYHFRSRL